MENFRDPQTYNYVHPKQVFLPDGFTHVDFVAEIGMALSLSISLFGLQEQASQLNELKTIIYAKMAEAKKQKGKRRTS